jgi:hypothetical protein
LTEGDARCVVDADMDELPACALASAVGAAALCSIAGDAVTDTLEAAELLDTMWISSPGCSRW